jgi:hypothetical protein
MRVKSFTSETKNIIICLLSLLFSGMIQLIQNALGCKENPVLWRDLTMVIYILYQCTHVPAGGSNPGLHGGMRAFSTLASAAVIRNLYNIDYVVYVKE